ncbi:reverse transcriptase domain-containing protein [Tanacetum coccineum]
MSVNGCGNSRESLLAFSTPSWSYMETSICESRHYTDIEKLYARHEEKHGFLGMIGSIDCTDCPWKNCLIALKELYTTFSTLAGKFRCRGISWVFDLNTSGLCPSYVEGLTAKGLGPSQDLIRARRGGLQAGEDAYGGEPSIDLIRSFLNLGRVGAWLTLSSRGGVDVPKALMKPVTHLEKWKGLKTSWKYRPKKHVIYHRGHAPMINAEHISVVHSLDITENIMDSRNTSSKESGSSLIGLDAPSYLEVGKKSKVYGKRKQYLREISIEQICDIHDKAYMRQAVLDNVLNDRTRELIFALHKARASCDTIREREIKKDKTHAELEKKCNEALQDLDKNPLIFDMRAEIETLQSRVNSLHNEYSRLILEEKKWINYEQTLSTLRSKVEGLEYKGKGLKASEIELLQEVDSLSQDIAAVVARVISDATMKLIHSDEMGVLIARLVKASIIHGRCATFEEVAELKKPFVLEKMPGYRPSSTDEYVRVGNDLADASYPFLAELSADPHAFVEQLLSKKPQSL